MNNIKMIKDKIRDELVEFKKKDFFEKTNILSFVCLCLFLLDCCFMGGGRFLSIGVLSLRMLLGVGCILFAVPSLLKKWTEHIKEPIYILFALFIIWLIVCTVRGWINGNNRVVLTSDLKGFMYLFLVPLAVNCITSKKRINVVMNVVLVGAFMQSLMVFVINMLCSIDISFLHAMYYPVFEMGLGTVSVVSNSIFRIFMNSAPYIIVACVIIVFRQFQQNTKGIFYPLLTAFYLNAILLTYTRSLYGSAGIAAVVSLIVALIIYPKRFKKLLKYIGVTVLCTFMLIAVEEFAFEASYFNFAVSRTFNTEIKFSYASTLRSKIRSYMGGVNDDQQELAEMELQEAYLGRTEESDSFRAITQNELMALVKKNPVFGNGLGACSATRNGPDEYFYLDVLARMGVIGLVLYLLPCAYIVSKMKKNSMIALILCTMLPFWIATAYNPWMNASIGIVWYAVVVADARSLCLLKNGELEQGD